MPPSLGPQPTAAVNEAIYEYLLATNDAQAPEHRALCSAPFLAEQTTRAREALYELSQLSSIGPSSRASYEAALRTLEALGEAVGMDATDEGYAFAYLALRSQVRPHTAADAHCALSALCSLLFSDLLCDSLSSGRSSALPAASTRLYASQMHKRAWPRRMHTPPARPTLSSRRLSSPRPQVVLSSLRRSPMDWKDGKMSLEAHFGGKRKRSRREEERCAMLVAGLEAAQRKDARHAQLVQQLLDKHPEDALHEHVRGWCEGVDVEHLPTARMKTELGQQAAGGASKQRAAAAPAARPRGKRAAPVEKLESEDEEADGHTFEGVLSHKLDAHGVARYKFSFAAGPVWAYASKYPEHSKAVDAYNEEHRLAEEPQPAHAPRLAPPPAPAPAPAPAQSRPSRRAPTPSKSDGERLGGPSLARSAAREEAESQRLLLEQAEVLEAEAAQARATVAEKERQAAKLRAAVELAGAEREAAGVGIARNSRPATTKQSPAAASPALGADRMTRGGGGSRRQAEEEEEAAAADTEPEEDEEEAAGSLHLSRKSTVGKRGFKSSAGARGHEAHCKAPRLAASSTVPSLFESSGGGAKEFPKGLSALSGGGGSSGLSSRLKARESHSQYRGAVAQEEEDSENSQPNHDVVDALANATSKLSNNPDLRDPLPEVLANPLPRSAHRAAGAAGGASSSAPAPAGSKAAGKRARITEGSSADGSAGDVVRWTRADDLLLSGSDDDEPAAPQSKAARGGAPRRPSRAERLLDDDDPIEEDDDEEESAPRLQPRHGGHSPLPERLGARAADGGASPRKKGGGSGGRGGGVKKRVRFSAAEEEALRDGYATYSGSNTVWAEILTKYRNVFDRSRSSVDLKDKWRNMQKKA